MRPAALPRPRRRARPRGPPRLPASPGLADPSLPEGTGPKGGAGRRLGRRDAPARGPRSWTPRPRDPRRGRRRGRGGGGRRRAGLGSRSYDQFISGRRGRAGSTEGASSSPSALPPRRLSAAGSRHDAKTAIERNRLRRAAPPRSLSPPPPERRHRLGSLPFPARGGGAHARPFRRRASAGRGGAEPRPLGKSHWVQRRLGLRTPDPRYPWRSPGASEMGRSGHRTDAQGSRAEAEDCLRWEPAARTGVSGVWPELLRHPGQLGNYWATLSPPAAMLACATCGEVSTRAGL